MTGRSRSRFWLYSQMLNINWPRKHPLNRSKRRATKAFHLFRVTESPRTPIPRVIVLQEQLRPKSESRSWRNLESVRCPRPWQMGSSRSQFHSLSPNKYKMWITKSRKLCKFWIITPGRKSITCVFKKWRRLTIKCYRKSLTKNSRRKGPSCRQATRTRGSLRSSHNRRQRQRGMHTKGS